MIKGFCRNCGNLIPEFSKVNSLYCSEYCRKAFYDTNKRKKRQIRANKEVLSVGKEVSNE